MTQKQANNPLHGITLEQIIIKLEKEMGWAEMGEQVKINCFTKDPSIKSSLKFLRKTPWARTQVEQLFINLNLTETPNNSFSWSKNKHK
ncbi:VF530 family DNA-binding protein [Pseudoalteromonas denitrificans]|uniref:Uncharacterized conserved protein n=1 Tax=Pseudoalteromonas denitrificans DSM 6059 TaxID=1123010 RepID=A0A1I1FS29_9GAMM|nr:VF530 family protein [Pseudoalteromonas denitrificans]SFC00448.1 Uncharacterized conserved protein [Pseudoalteromonas denitrificans DSM 6059]